VAERLLVHPDRYPDDGTVGVEVEIWRKGG
jgi:hypothetical protein